MKKLKLVLIDDDAEFLNESKEMLEQTGYEVLCMKDSEYTVERLRLEKPDVILLDINLPDINGFEALKILRSDPATAHIPVVALSANAMPLDTERGLKAGFFRYITKPIKVKELMDTLNVALAYAAEGKV